MAAGIEKPVYISSLPGSSEPLFVVEQRGVIKTVRGGGEYTNYISSFGEDADGELYIVNYNGEIYRLIAAR